MLSQCEQRDEEHADDSLIEEKCRAGEATDNSGQETRPLHSPGQQHRPRRVTYDHILVPATRPPHQGELRRCKSEIVHHDDEAYVAGTEHQTNAQESQPTKDKIQVIKKPPTSLLTQKCNLSIQLTYRNKFKLLATALRLCVQQTNAITELNLILAC